MKKFIHFELENIETYLNSIAAIHQSYVLRDMAFFNKVDGLLQNLISFFETNQKFDFASRIRSLLSDLHSLNRGYHPYLFEKIEHHKRDIQFSVSLKILKEAESFLLIEYANRKEKLEEAIPHINHLLLAGFQIGLINNNLFCTNMNQQGLNQVWALLGTDDNLNLLQKKIVLITSQYDALVLLDLALNKLR